MTSIAKAIETLAKDSTDAIAMAEPRAIAADQNWQEENTTYTFDDNSVLVVSGPNYFAKEGASA